jgi:hypothetical protein
MNKGRQKPKIKKSTLIISAMIVVVLLGGWLLWYQRSNTIYAPNKIEVRKKLEDALASFANSGVIKDQGCDDGNSVGLAVYIHCDFEGDVYTSYRGDIGVGLRNADQLLQEEGWEHSDPNEETYEVVFEKKSPHQLPYDRQGVHLYLVFYDSETKISSRSLDQDYGQDEGHSVIGLWGTSSYWACSWNSIFELPCVPPSIDKSVMYKW